MFEKQRILGLLLASGLLASCGGGSSGSSTAPAGAGPTTTASTPDANSAATPPVTPAATPSTGTTTPASTPTIADRQFNGYFEMVADQVLYIRTNRVLYHPVPFPQFESDSGIVDVASGSTQAPPLNIDIVTSGCTIAKDGMCGIQPPAAAPVAPIAAFGLRVDKFIHPLAQGQDTANQSVTGRIAVDLTERADSPGIGTGEAPEIMRFVIDGVKMTTDESGKLASVEMQSGATIHVYGRTASGAEVRDDIPAPAGTVRLLPVSQIPDNNGDTGSVVILLDLETGFSQATPALAALKNIAGHFSMNVTLSMVPKIVRPAAAATADYPGVDLKELVGKPITVNTQPAVAGGGIVGNAWIRMFP